LVYKEMGRILEDIVALVPAAGSGERLGRGPKAFLQCEGRSLIERVVHTLHRCVGRVVVGVPEDRLQFTRSKLDKWAQVFSGCLTRQTTIHRLMQETTEPIVLIHDVTRPFASQRLFRKIIQAARDYRAAAVFVPSHIPAAEHRDGFVTRAIPKSDFMLPQSPMAFQREVLEKAYRHANKEGIELQTTWELLVRIGVPVRIIPGEDRNIKITVPFDWEIARKIIAPSLESIKEKGI
jgi:2-C-methyl-D-erythritol 4-phosphate cytidylyltransferase